MGRLPSLSGETPQFESFALALRPANWTGLSEAIVFRLWRRRLRDAHLFGVLMLKADMEVDFVPLYGEEQPKDCV